MSNYLKKKIKVNDVISLDINNISKATKSGIMKITTDGRHLKIKIDSDIKTELPAIQEGD